MRSSLLVLDGICAGFTVYLLKRLLSDHNTRSPLPPGPPGWPVIGNLLEWPKGKEWLTFGKWANIYGDVVHANIFGTHFVVLHSAEAASALLDSKGAIYSDRPSLHFAGVLGGWNGIIGLLNDGARFRETRRMLAQEIGTRSALTRFIPQLEVEARKFVTRILEQPHHEGLPRQIKLMNGANILNIAYGYQVERNDDQLVGLIGAALQKFEASGVPGSHLVDAFPWLDCLPSWFPGTGYRADAAQMRDTAQKFVNTPYQYVLDQKAAGTARPSFVSSHLDQGAASAEQVDTLKWAAASLYAGGEDTTTSFFLSFFLFLTLHPEAQAKAQAEIDAVLGKEQRLPILADRPDLPYVEALIKEVFRCGIVGALALPHVLREDDTYNGYFIPKGTFVIPNIWYMTHDARVYSDPDSFRPERFLGPTPEPDPRNVVFGFGRRICPGKLFAENVSFLFCAVSLACLTVSKAKDADGKEIVPVPDYQGVVIAQPVTFPCHIAPRSSKIAALVHTELGH